MMKPEEKEMISYLEDQGYGVIPPQQFRSDIGKDFIELWNRVAAFTMTSMERGFALYNAAKYVSDRGIPGDFAECGVWKGGSCMLMALALLETGTSDRRIWLYDTFTGMPEPGDNDRVAWNDSSVRLKWEEDRLGIKDNFGSWAVGLNEVRTNIESTDYPGSCFEFVKGPVEETLCEKRPASISLLRLDTDWYESTKAELEILYPLLSPGGVLIIDDYGHFTGARKAVDEYFDSIRPAPLLNRIDYTGRICVKPE